MKPIMFFMIHTILFGFLMGTVFFFLGKFYWITLLVFQLIILIVQVDLLKILATEL